MKALVLMAVSLLLGACSGAGSTVPASEPPVVETTTQPSASASSALPADSWGPLAVRPPDDGTDTARAEGTLRITDSCVYLDWAGDLMLLTWPADRTTWNGAAHEITFLNHDGPTVTIGDGEYVVLGGGGDSTAESGTSGEDWIAGRSWIAAPASSCLLDTRWAVGAVADWRAAIASIDPSFLTQPRLTCDTDALAFPPSALDGPTGAEAEVDSAATALRVFVAGPDAPTNWDPGPAWRRVLETPQAVVFLGQSVSTNSPLFVAFSLSRSGWTFDVAGTCQLRVVLPADVGPLTWELDPASPVRPDSASVSVLARELACSGGKDPSDRLLAPIVTVDLDRVNIALAARILPGDHDCPGNPITGVRVDLPEPLGERHLYDGSVFPPAERK